MKKTDSNKAKHKTQRNIDIPLIIIAVFCFLIVVFIGYNCLFWRRRRTKRKPKPAQRKIKNRQNENGRSESGELLNNRSQSEDSLDFEEQDPGHQPFEENSKKERKHSTQNSSSPSTIGYFLSRIMSSLPGRGRSPRTDAECSGKNVSNGASTSKQGQPSNNKGRLKKSRSYSPEHGNEQKSESFADSKNTKNDKQLAKGFEQKKNAKRSPTGEHPLGSSPTHSAHLTGFNRGKGAEKPGKISKSVNKSNCTGSTCQKCSPYNDEGSYIVDQTVGDDSRHRGSAEETESMRNERQGPSERGKQYRDLGEDGGNRRGERREHATRQTNHDGISGERSKEISRDRETGKDSDRMAGNEHGSKSGVVSGRRACESSHAAPESQRAMHSGGRKSASRQPTHESATSRAKHGSKLEKNSAGKTDSLGTRGVPDEGPNARDKSEEYVLIESSDLNDQGNGQMVEEHIRRPTANTVEYDDQMEVETDYKRDEIRNQPTRPRKEATSGEPGIGGGRAIEKPKHEKRIESIGEMYNVMQYARSEWKSDTVTAQTVRDGYFCIPEELGLRNLRVIRGDNYCAIRATLFQVLAKRIPFLNKLQNVEKIPHQLMASGDDPIDDWAFASRIKVARHKVCQEMETCLRELSKLVDLISGMDQEEGRISQLLVNFNCKAFEIEIRLLEAVKFLMFYQATLLYRKMKANEDVPIFAMIMFARDSCEDPWHFMTKHLNYVGDTGGLEQVEMHLLGYTLGVTIKVVRPSHFGKSDFIASYPEDMPDGTPVIALIAEDDRHYNILS